MSEAEEALAKLHGSVILSLRDALASLPISVSEQEFRLAARRLGLNLLSGRSMMIKRESIPLVLQEMETVRRRKTGTWHVAKPLVRAPARKTNARDEALRMLAERKEAERQKRKRR